MKVETTETLSCQRCHQHFASQGILEEHWNQECQVQEMQPYYFYPEMNVYICNCCSAEFQEEKKVQEHVRIHAQIFSCEICQEKIEDPFYFSVHMQTHNPNRLFQCPLCKRYTTSNRGSMTSHINRIHFQKFYFYCNTCGNGFNSQTRLKEHQLVHLDIKPFTCVVCNTVFTYFPNLLKHQISYHSPDITGQPNKTKCSFCSKRFANETTLDKHIKTRH